MKSSLHLESQRLMLLPWESRDWEGLFPIAQDPKVLRYVSAGIPWPKERVCEFVARQRRHLRESGFCFWKLELKSNGRLCGFCALQPLEELNGMSDPPAPGTEIGCWVASDLWGQGIASEAARVALADGFERAGLERIVALAVKENEASLRIMDKLGMSRKGEVVHRGYSVLEYEILKHEFETIRQTEN